MADACGRQKHHHLDVPELGEDEGAFLFLACVDVKAVLVLLGGETIVAQARSEAGITRLPSLLYAPEKAVKGPIHPLEDVLQDLRVHLGPFHQGWSSTNKTMPPLISMTTTQARITRANV